MDLPFPLFCQAGRRRDGQGRISPPRGSTDPATLAVVCAELLDRFRQPVLVETFLPGREFTVGILGTGRRARAIAAMEVFFGAGADPDFYTFDNKEVRDGRVPASCSRVPTAAAADVALAAWRALGCRDGGRVDLRPTRTGARTSSRSTRSPGLHPVRSDLTILAGLAGIGHTELIGRILESALQRRPWAGARAAGGHVMTGKLRVAVLYGAVPAKAPADEQDVLIEAEAVAAALRAHGYQPLLRAVTSNLDSCNTSCCARGRRWLSTWSNR